ncbi:MAG: hypothetical protein IPP72_06495 [Chitinophagaceae bacterium]|nr:hypothetical protein [Chitinophagaceae bacterium]
MSQPKPLQWKEISPDSIKPSQTVSLDLGKLPVIPFAVNDFKPFKNPIQSRKLDWDHIPDSAVNFDTIPSRPFKLQQSILPKPVITKAGIPKLMSNTTSGILQFSEEEGLPGTAITASLLDEQGMVWLATNKGLCRYTGELLHVYSITNKAPQGSDYPITSMTTAGDGRIWMTTAGDGIHIIDINKGLLLHDNSQMVALDITHSYDGNMWVTGFENNQNAIYIINAEKQTIKKIYNPYYCFQVKEDKNHHIWMGNNQSISIISSDRKKIKRLSQKEGLDIKTTFKLFEDSKGDMWIGSFAREINIISLKNKTISTLNASNGFTVFGAELAEDRKGKVWAIEKDTIYVFNKERTAFKIMHANF